MPDTAEVRRLYDDMASWWRWTAVPDTLLGLNRLRRIHLGEATGRVLDVACGTGENFSYLRHAEHVTAVDLSPRMVARARSRALRSGRPFTVIEADASSMPFRDHEFDTVVSAFSTCTFPDPVGSFAEMARVTRPGGRILLLEHGLSSVEWIARRQRAKAAKSLARAACRVDRDVVAELAAAGLRPSFERRSHLGMIRRLTVEM